jgi:hypothetical protein
MPPPTLVFCDQNFVPTLSGKQSCIAITRLEDCSLTELTDLALEVLERQSIPLGSILLLGSAGIEQVQRFSQMTGAIPSAN